MDPVLEMHSLRSSIGTSTERTKTSSCRTCSGGRDVPGRSPSEKLGTLIVTLAFIAIILSVESVMLYQTLHTNNNFQGFCRACCRSYRPLWYSGRKLPCHAALEKAAGKACDSPISHPLA